MKQNQNEAFDRDLFIKYLLENSRCLGIDLSHQSLDLMATHASLLTQSTRMQNLTGLKNTEDIAEGLFLDSLGFHLFYDTAKFGRLADIGTGAGFPGLPIKCTAPDLDLTLIESEKRKVEFLNNAVHCMSLSRIHVKHGRVEDLSWDHDLRESFDVVLAKAVAPLNVLLEYGLPLLKNSGILLAWKGLKAEEELKGAGNALLHLGGRLDRIDKWLLPKSNRTTCLISVIKIRKMSKYPRRAGIPSKHPL